jgi:hypothetical protein
MLNLDNSWNLILRWISLFGDRISPYQRYPRPHTILPRGKIPRPRLILPILCEQLRGTSWVRLQPRGIFFGIYLRIRKSRSCSTRSLRFPRLFLWFRVLCSKGFLWTFVGIHRVHQSRRDKHRVGFCRSSNRIYVMGHSSSLKQIRFLRKCFAWRSEVPSFTLYRHRLRTPIVNGLLIAYECKVLEYWKFYSNFFYN